MKEKEWTQDETATMLIQHERFELSVPKSASILTVIETTKGNVYTIESNMSPRKTLKCLAIVFWRALLRIIRQPIERLTDKIRGRDKWD